MLHILTRHTIEDTNPMSFHSMNNKLQVAGLLPDSLEEKLASCREIKLSKTVYAKKWI